MFPRKREAVRAVWIASAQPLDLESRQRFSVVALKNGDCFDFR